MPLLLTGCENESERETPPGSAPKALVIGVDGLRGDGIPGAETPRLDALMESAAYTLFASTQLEAQTVSGPGWTSILTGVDADKHGIHSNSDWLDIDRSYPTMIARAFDLGLPTATAINWTPIQLNIIESGVTDEAILGTDEEVASGMADLLETEDFDLHFVHLDDVDHAGHSSGFSTGNPEYVEAVEVIDVLVGQMLDAVEARSTRSGESWLIALTSDHGGLSTGHGGTTPDYRAIPLILAGDPVSPGEFPGAGEVPGELDGGFHSHMDPYPTVFEHLGHAPQADWGLDGATRGLAPDAS